MMLLALALQAAIIQPLSSSSSARDRTVSEVVGKATGFTNAQLTGQPWSDSDDYPEAARRQKIQGPILIRISADSAGRVLNCAIKMSTGSKELDDKTCELARKRLRLKPARDIDGTSIASVETIGTSWFIPELGIPAEYVRPRIIDLTVAVTRIPTGVTEPFAVVRQLVSADGTVEGCTISRSSGSTALDDAACKVLAESPIEQAIGRDGKPLRSVTSTSVHFVQDKKIVRLNRPCRSDRRVASPSARSRSNRTGPA